MMLAPEWDGESHCTVDGCHDPAMFERLTGVVEMPGDGDGFAWAVEMVCVSHAESGKDYSDPWLSSER